MENIKKKFQIVVARYNEDIRWLLPFRHITIIYNKGKNNFILNKFETIQLENFGRESHTYLYHIITNYDNLAERTIFFQGKINDHKVLDIERYFSEEEDIISNYNVSKIDILKRRINHFGKYKKEYFNGLMKICEYNPYDWIKNIIGINLDNLDIFNVIWGANFSISKKLILSKPKVFYENIFRYINYHINPEEGHILERSWYLIFNQSYIPKKKIGYIINKDKINIDNIEEYDEIHLWNTVYANSQSYDKIDFTLNISKYLNINPIIEDNSFHIKVKTTDDFYILIDTDLEDTSYEIIFIKNTVIIKDFYNNKILGSYNQIDINNFIDLTFLFSDRLIIKYYNIVIFDISYTHYSVNIKEIKVKSTLNSIVFYDYKTSEFKVTTNQKKFITNNIYNVDYYYKKNYLDYYITKID